jgi:AraC-like DNA-binding protein
MRKYSAPTAGFILGTWIKAIMRALDAAGCDGAGLVAGAGFDIGTLDAPNVRCPLGKTARLWRLALAATGDPAFGLKVASQIKPTTFHALGYGLSASSTLKEAFERVQRYCHVVSDAVEYRFVKVGAVYHFDILPSTDVPIESIDTLVGSFLRMCRSSIGREFSPLLIELRRPRPASLAEFERLLRAPLRFDAERNRLTFAADGIERRLDAGNPELARHSDAIANRHLVRTERDNIEARVRAVVERRLSEREPSPEEVACLLNVSARTLQRRLADAGTTFKAILDDTRRTLAFAYLSARQQSPGEITYLLGFSCSSSFTRAFRRWTGQSPSAWQAGHAAPMLPPAPIRLRHVRMPGPAAAR